MGQSCRVCCSVVCSGSSFVVVQFSSKRRQQRHFIDRFSLLALFGGESIRNPRKEEGKNYPN